MSVYQSLLVSDSDMMLPTYTGLTGILITLSFGTAVGLLVMMYPILCKVRFEALHELFATRSIWKQIAFSIFVNWIVAPFLMVRFLPDKNRSPNPGV